MNSAMRKRFACVVALAAALFAWVMAGAVGVGVVAPAAFVSTGLGPPLTTHPQAMDGDLKVAQG